MKVCLALLLVAICATQIDAFWGGRGGFGGGWGRRGFGWGGGFGRWGPGFGWGGPWGGFGGGFGLGGIPVAVPVPVAAPVVGGFGGAVGVGGFGGVGVGFGKRSAEHVEEVKQVEKVEQEEFEFLNSTSSNFTDDSRQLCCHYSSKSSRFTCRGINRLNCSVTQNFGDLSSFKFRLHDLSICNSTNEDRFRIFSRVLGTTELSNVTVVEPTTQKNIVFSIYNSEKINDIGFRFVDESCWSEFSTLVQKFKPESVKLSLFIEHKGL